VTEFPLPASSGPPGAITTGPDGNLWYVEVGNGIGRITPAGIVTRFPVPVPNCCGWQDSIIAGPDGTLWFNQFHTGKVGRITTAGSVSEVTLPTRDSGLTSIAAGPNGTLWVTESHANKIAVLPAITCGTGPRPPVQVLTQRTGAGTLQININATTNAGTPANQLVSVQLAPDAHTPNPNALIDVPGGPTSAAPPLAIAPPDGATNVTFTVRAASPGQPITLPVTVVDACGPWPTLIGSGTGGLVGGGTEPPVATPTPTPTPLPPPSGLPNVGISVTPHALGGSLQATIAARDANCRPNNRLLSLRFTRLTNATVDVPTTPPVTVAAAPASVPLAGQPQSITLNLRRVTAGQAATAELVVSDSCGEWPTLVGGGPSAFH
jgi:hypothetical protein